MCPCLLFFVLFIVALCLLISVKILRLTNLDILFRIRDALRNGKPFITALFRVDAESQRHGGELVAKLLKPMASASCLPCVVVTFRQFWSPVNKLAFVYWTRGHRRVCRRRGRSPAPGHWGGSGHRRAGHHKHSDRVEKCTNGRVAGAFVGRRVALPFEGARGFDIDQQTLVRSLCKFSARVTYVRHIVPTIRNAIATAKSGTPGPVFVELPIDVLYPYKSVEREAGLSNAPKKGLVKTLLDAYVRTHIANFSDAWQPEQPLLPLPVRVPRPTTAQIDQLANLFFAARDQVPWFNSAVGCELSHVNYDERDRLRQALAQCQGRRRRNSAVAEEKDGTGGNNGTTDDSGGQSTVLNALIGRTNFREGSINV
ncbi:hypothetical protein niasHS_000758 [Heterodera schachtii]|uniref:Uncharacterized protein n=1 Tax=Heterodera schachtii TaxID=97005 RepID=A0ABD2KKV2_HETSC